MADVSQRDRPSFVARVWCLISRFLQHDIPIRHDTRHFSLGGIVSMSHERKLAFVLGVSDSVRLAPVEPGLPYYGTGNRSARLRALPRRIRSKSAEAIV